jgi:hypothetical protein
VDDRSFRAEFHRALDPVAPPAPWLAAAVRDGLQQRRRTIRRSHRGPRRLNRTGWFLPALELRGPEAPRLMALIAVLLALAIVISMLMVRGLHLLGPTPAGQYGVTPCGAVKYEGAQLQPTAVATNNPSAATPISAAEFAATGVNSPSLITPLHVESKAADYDVTLVGAYADSARLVLIYHALPSDLMSYSAFGFYDGQESVVADPPVGGGGEVAPGDYVEQIDAGPAASAGRVAHLLAYPPFYAAPLWKFDLPVQRSICFSTGGPYQLGRRSVSFTKLEVTPSTLHIRALVADPSGQDLADLADLTVMAVDQNGTRLPEVGEGVREVGFSNDTPDWLIDYQWMRPVGAGTYLLLFQATGATHTVTLDVPASAAI